MATSSSSSSSFSLRAATHFRPRHIPTLLHARRREISSQFFTHPTARIKPTQKSIPGHIPKKQIIKEEQGEDGEEKKSLRIGILGFGNFGQFIAKRMVRQGHEVMATSRRDYSAECRRDGVQFFKSVEEMCAQKPDVVLVCTSILSTESVLRSVPFHLLKPDTIFADVLSVKQYPRNLFLEVLPPEYGIICTHPMFGPESRKNGWAGLPFVFENVRIPDKGDQAKKCSQFLSIFELEGCRMVEMSCEEHDRHAASTQFITHTIGRVLSELNLESTPINTKGFETLLKLIENLDRAFDAVKQKLFSRLHDILKKQIMERAPLAGGSSSSAAAGPSFLLKNGDIRDVASFAAAPPSESASGITDYRSPNSLVS